MQFDYTTHYKTLCDKKSHFSRISDSIAEFVDNSIQATSKNIDERQIKVGCFFSNFSSPRSIDDEGFLIIADNGLYFVAVK